jgi:hypothetical protein
VVAVVSAQKYARHAYVAATVYELTPRKDGVLVYRRSGEQAEPHRSERLALKDAQEIADRLDIPLWAHVRYNMTVLDAKLGVDDGDDEIAKEFRVEYVENPYSLRNQLARDDDDQRTTPASAYRLTQAEELLAEMGYVRQSDGTWLLPLRDDGDETDEIATMLDDEDTP